MAIAAILRRDHHCSGNFLQDGGEEIYRNGTEGSNPACSSGESAANLLVGGEISPAGGPSFDLPRPPAPSPSRRIDPLAARPADDQVVRPGNA